MSNLTTRLEQLEAEIEKGIRTVGRCLIEVRDSGCYKDEYASFEDYCKQRWSFSDRHVRRLIDVERVKTKIGQICPVETLKDSHIFEIAKIPEKKQAQVAAEVLEQCELEDRKPTARDFKRAAAPFIAPPEVVLDGEYEDVVDDEPTIAEQISNHRSVAMQHYKAAMRAVDDMNRLRRDPDNIKIVETANVTIQDAVKGGWK